MPQPEAHLAEKRPFSHVFVYGTLRRGEQRDINSLLPTPTWLGFGCVTGTLYDLGSYPGLQLGTGELREILGEVYRITPEVERQLDVIEEVQPCDTGEYIRRQVLVTLRSASSDAKPLPCLVYEVSPAARVGKPVIVEGDWVDYRLRKLSKPDN